MTADASGFWLTLLRDLSVKSALLLLAAWALTLTMRRASASARHLVWLLVFAGLLALPLLSVTLPARPVPVLPAAPVAAAPVPMAAAPEAVPDLLPAPLVPATPAVTRPMPPAPPARHSLLCLLWLGGAALFSAPVVLGLALAGRRIRRCRPVADPVVLALAAEAARRLGVRRPVSLRSGSSMSVPVTFGLMCPVILLPDGAASWPAERLRVALLHEMAHVKRADWATQTAARLVCALFWHNPLVLPAARMLRAEAERACDDLVLSSGVPAPDYAQHLLAVAAALSGAARPLPLAVPMAGCGPLESRLRAVLSPRPRRALSRPRALFAFVLALFVLVPLAALRPAARAARRVVRPLPLAPAVIPPKAARPHPAPVKAATAAPPAPLPTQSTSLGVPPMKMLTPAKTVALAALAATLTLPAAQAKPTAPVKRTPAQTLAGAGQTAAALKDIKASDIQNQAGSDKRNVVTALKQLFSDNHKDYVLEPGVTGTVNVHLDGVPFGRALTTLLEASSHPLDCIVEYDPARGDVYHIQPRIAVTGAKEAVPPTPRQVQVKFEWVASAGTSDAAPDKSMDSLTIVAEDGRKTEVSSQHLRDGAGGKETITVLARLHPGGQVTMDITAYNDSTARAGETFSNAIHTLLGCKDGETRVLNLSNTVSGSGPGQQSAQRALFVTPTIIGGG